jgi:hypothetical protein
VKIIFSTAGNSGEAAQQTREVGLNKSAVHPPI